MRTKNRWLIVAIIAALVSLGMIAAACGDDSDGDSDGDVNGPPAVTTTVDVGLTEFTVSPSPESASAGSVTFNVSNDSDVQSHNLKVIRTDLDPDALPVEEAAFAVDEDQVDVVASSSDMATGSTEEVTADLEAGSYVLICNVPSHYQSGMTVAFTVE